MTEITNHPASRRSPSPPRWLPAAARPHFKRLAKRVEATQAGSSEACETLIANAAAITAELETLHRFLDANPAVGEAPDQLRPEVRSLAELTEALRGLLAELLLTPRALHEADYL